VGDDAKVKARLPVSSNPAGPSRWALAWAASAQLTFRSGNPRDFQLVLNAKRTKDLSLTIPENLLALTGRQFVALYISPCGTKLPIRNVSY
jgi:hypothetical protein